MSTSRCFSSLLRSLLLEFHEVARWRHLTYARLTLPSFVVPALFRHRPPGARLPRTDSEIYLHLFWRGDTRERQASKARRQHVSWHLPMELRGLHRWSLRVRLHRRRRNPNPARQTKRRASARLSIARFRSRMTASRAAIVSTLSQPMARPTCKALRR